MNAEAPGRPAVAAARRVVVKLGTRVLTHDDGRLALSRLFGVVEAVGHLAGQGRELIVVSSGAVGLGREALALEGQLDLVEHQACAAIGQSRLMGLYEQGFARLGLVCAQILLTQGSFDDRIRYLSLRAALDDLLRRRVIPVINMNDAVCTAQELEGKEDDAPHVFGDNDRLASLVATKLGADLLVLLTDVAGVYDGDPRRDEQARLIETVDQGQDLSAAAGAGSQVSKGGMKSKVAAAELAARGGCQVVVASGREPRTIERIAAGEKLGTWFPARGELDARRRWIAFAAPPRGDLTLDQGAVEALRHRAASLLSIGVSGIEGEFVKGDVVNLRGPTGELIARGMVSCSAAEVRVWQLQAASGKTVVRREQLVLEKS